MITSVFSLLLVLIEVISRDGVVDGLDDPEADELERQTISRSFFHHELAATFKLRRNRFADIYSVEASLPEKMKFLLESTARQCLADDLGLSTRNGANLLEYKARCNVAHDAALDDACRMYLSLGGSHFNELSTEESIQKRKFGVLPFSGGQRISVVKSLICKHMVSSQEAQNTHEEHVDTSNPDSAEPNRDEFFYRQSAEALAERPSYFGAVYKAESKLPARVLSSVEKLGQECMAKDSQLRLRQGSNLIVSDVHFESNPDWKTFRHCRRYLDTVSDAFKTVVEKESTMIKNYGVQQFTPLQRLTVVKWLACRRLSGVKNLTGDTVDVPTASHEDDSQFTAKLVEVEIDLGTQVKNVLDTLVELFHDAEIKAKRGNELLTYKPRCENMWSTVERRTNMLQWKWLTKDLIRSSCEPFIDESAYILNKLMSSRKDDQSLDEAPDFEPDLKTLVQKYVICRSLTSCSSTGCTMFFKKLRGRN